MPANLVHLACRINGTPVELDVKPHQTLLDMLRDAVGLTGTKECCAEGECGACTVFINGRSVTSCLVLAAEVDGDEVTTIEGLAENGALNRVQQAFVETGAVQCGFCIPGMVMSAEALLRTTPHPTREEIEDALSGNLCRCAGYSRILEAVERAAGVVDLPPKGGSHAGGSHAGGTADARGFRLQAEGNDR
jgi:carbon-monoxide dehydrogenase small subunit